MEAEMETEYRSDLGQQVKAPFRVGSTEYPIFFRSGTSALTVTPESRITATLLPSMKVGSDIVEGEPVSPKFLEAIDEIQDILCCWHSQFEKVDVRATPADKKTTPVGGRVGCFFTGGVDSFYTLLKHKDEIDDLIFVHGFDMSLQEAGLREKTSRTIREVATELEKETIEIETNLRTLLDSHLGWDWAHGAALACVGHVLAEELDRLYIPATHTYCDLFPWGSHPLLDPLWGTEHLQFVHDGCEANRVEKVELISEYDVALESLRVCYKNPNGVYNCGECEKCLRTMINLRCVDALNRCPTFNTSLDLQRVAGIKASDLNTIAFIRENIEVLEEQEKDHQLQNALRTALTRLRIFDRVKKIGRKVRARIRTVFGF